MKKLNTFIALVVIGTLTLFSAFSQNDEPTSIADVNNESIQEKELGEVLANTIENSNREENDYIIYDAEAKEFFTLSETTYLLANTFADKVTSDSDIPTRAPGQWIKGGTGKGKMDAMKLASKLSKQIPSKKNFEIRVVYNKDGSYTIYYRLI